jgi:Tfp pilus assembly protein PilF
MLIERGRYLEAEALLREALAEGVHSASVHAKLALCLHHAGLTEAAKDELHSALSIDPNYAYAHYVLSFLNPPKARNRRSFLSEIASSTSNARWKLNRTRYPIFRGSRSCASNRANGSKASSQSMPRSGSRRGMSVWPCNALKR